ncbi:MAG: hypothetical protein RL376_643, partial [Verrucomicrobiota bacterium]
MNNISTYSNTAQVVPGAIKRWQAQVRVLVIVSGCCAVGQAKPVP